MEAVNEKVGNYSRYFFVDYENVKTSGLNGIVKLSENDCVRIYYSKAAEMMTFGLHRRICASVCHFEYIKVDMPIKNAVDCQILFDIRDYLRVNPQAEYIVISKDSDFDKPINQFKERKAILYRSEEICKGKVNDSEQEDIVEATKEKSKAKGENMETSKPKPENFEKTLRSCFGQHFKKKCYVEKKEAILGAFLKAKNKKELRALLLNEVQENQVELILEKLKAVVKKLAD